MRKTNNHSCTDIGIRKHFSDFADSFFNMSCTSPSVHQFQNTVTSDSCRLVNRNNVNDVLDRVYDYCMRNETVSTKLAIGNNVSVGDVVEIPTIYDEVVKCRLTRIKLSFGNTKMAGEVDGLVIDN